MNTNKLNDNIENDSLDESEIYDEEPNNFFLMKIQCKTVTPK